MFLHLSVILFIGENASRIHHLDAPPQMHPSCMQPTDAPPPSASGDATPSPQWMDFLSPRQKTNGQQAVGTHRTGMHSCFRNS